MPDSRTALLKDLTEPQKQAVSTKKRLSLILAGAGSGKTEVMARRVAWWIAIDRIPRESIVAFTFTERAAEEMKFRIRRMIEQVTPSGEEPTLGGMYVGTIHGFCLKALKDLKPDQYHNYEVIDDAARMALVQRGFHRIIDLQPFRDAYGGGYLNTIGDFLSAYDLLNEFDLLNVKLPAGEIPHTIEDEKGWCTKARLATSTGHSLSARAFGRSAARYYAYLHCRRFLDFSTSQSELMRVLRGNKDLLSEIRRKLTHLVVDEVQDLNTVQDHVLRTLIGKRGTVTAVGDHRQAIYGWRGGKVDIMGKYHQEFRKHRDGIVIDLQHNYRSTPRIIEIANRWADTIGRVRTMESSPMIHGNAHRTDRHPSHVAAVHFKNHQDEAEWIARSIRKLVPSDSKGALHTDKGASRGITYSDVAILIRSATDIGTYMEALKEARIPAVFRAGPDLFSQPEVLFFMAAMAEAAGIDSFFVGGWNRKQFGNRLQDILGSAPIPSEAMEAAAALLRDEGLPFPRASESRILSATALIQRRLRGEPRPSPSILRSIKTPSLRDFLSKDQAPRRVFPQQIYHFLLSEADVGAWESRRPRGQDAMYHLGQLSALIAGLETPGWTRTEEFRFQILGLCLWGSENARTEEAPLLVQPNAVTVGTIHSAKGLEHAAVFVADVGPRRFPSQFAKRTITTPCDGRVLKQMDLGSLSDNDNYDAERRLMYVAITRSERYLAISGSSKKRPSAFFSEIEAIVRSTGGVVGREALAGPKSETIRSSFRRDLRLVTSFSDLRYYLECPHDFYLRKVLGFAPTIDQAFGFGRGVHNILRAIHEDPKVWAALSRNKAKLETLLTDKVSSGLFYLRHTTGEPAEKLRKHAVRILTEYVVKHAGELRGLEFEPEKEFETLLPEEQVLINGAIDVVRLDSPPRVTIVDFKSGDPESDAQGLDEEEMKLQVSLYGLAAKKELAYKPELGLVRYLGGADPEHSELKVPLDTESIQAARKVVKGIAHSIRQRDFHKGPKSRNGKPGHARCKSCDFVGFCGMKSAARQRTR